MAKSEKVFIIDHVLDLVTLFEILLGEAGYKTATALMPGTGIAKVSGVKPDVILADLIAGHKDDLELLDQFRIDPNTRTTPVVAMSTMPDVLGQAIASYNVRQVLLKPFDVDDLLLKVRAAIDRSAFLVLPKETRPSTKPIFSEVATALAAASRAMVIRWVQCMAVTEPFRSRRLNWAKAIDRVPVLLEAVLLALRSDDFRASMTQNPDIRQQVTEHVQLRRSQGIPLADIVREHQCLREEIRGEIVRILQGRNVTPEQTLEIVTRKDYALDTIIRLTIEIYEQEEARR